MKRFILFLTIGTLAACSKPALQTDIFTKSTTDMEKVDSECANKANDKKTTHVVTVNCRFDAYETILGERGFQEYNDLDILKMHFIDTAEKQDADEISDAEAHAFTEGYTKEFFERLQQRDKIKIRGYEIQKAQTLSTIATIAVGLSVGLQAYADARYPVTPVSYQPSCPACEQQKAMGHQMVNQAQAQQQQYQQQQNMEAQQQQIQQQQNEINRLNGRSSVEVLKDCIHAGNCVGAFAPPYAQDNYGTYGSVPQSR